MFEKVALIAVLAVSLLASSIYVQAAHLVLNSDPGEAITGGQHYDITYTSQNAPQSHAIVEKFTTGLPSFLDFAFFPPPRTMPDAS